MSKGPLIAAVMVALMALVATPCVADAKEGPGAKERRKEREAAHQRALKAFGPFDGGERREVVRQGSKGKKRAAYPMVGDAAKVPGEGPPPPPLRLSPDIPEAALQNPNSVGGGLSSNPLYLAALGYQHIFTKLDGPRCQHLPTCSRFGSQAVAKHGLLGIPMTLDRLIQPHESSALRHLPEVEGWGVVRVFDPMENYEFWKPERFSAFLLAVPEQALPLPPLPKSSLSTPPAAPETPTP
ncbi:MAG: membrane protein insertion efficiency factor YidD [Deltaproteobacteria bacterium]|nr:membrane protein insertion efficiency factor YidD [Deltaproteobacteria bacterium]